MKIFVSGQINDIENVRQVQNALIDAGHTITHDWTRNESGDKMLAGREAKLQNTQESARRAKLDIDGVLDADAYIICTDNERLGRGMYVELGAAIALLERTGNPRIFLIGEMNHLSIFYLHGAICRVASVEELVDKIGAIASA